jgi:hypothetical protein
MLRGKCPLCSEGVELGEEFSRCKSCGEVIIHMSLDEALQPKILHGLDVGSLVLTEVNTRDVLFRSG